jgi:hypothetical protein
MNQALADHGAGSLLDDWPSPRVGIDEDGSQAGGDARLESRIRSRFLVRTHFSAAGVRHWLLWLPSPSVAF